VQLCVNVKFASFILCERNDNRSLSIYLTISPSVKIFICLYAKTSFAPLRGSRPAVHLQGSVLSYRIKKDCQKRSSGPGVMTFWSCTRAQHTPTHAPAEPGYCSLLAVVLFCCYTIRVVYLYKISFLERGRHAAPRPWSTPTATALGPQEQKWKTSNFSPSILINSLTENTNPAHMKMTAVGYYYFPSTCTFLPVCPNDLSPLLLKAIVIVIFCKIFLAVTLKKNLVLKCNYFVSRLASW